MALQMAESLNGIFRCAWRGWKEGVVVARTVMAALDDSTDFFQFPGLTNFHSILLHLKEILDFQLATFSCEGRIDTPVSKSRPHVDLRIQSAVECSRID